MDVNKPKYYGLCKNCDIEKCNNDFKKCPYKVIDSIEIRHKREKLEKLYIKPNNIKNNKGMDKWLSSA